MSIQGLPSIYKENTDLADLRGRAVIPGAQVSPGVVISEPLTDWQRYSRAVRRRWKVALAIVIIGTTLGFFVSQRLNPSFNAVATVWLEPTAPMAGVAGAFDQTGGVVPASSWPDLARSVSVLTPVVDSLRLYVKPEHPQHHQLFMALQPSGNPQPGEYSVVGSEDGKSVELLSGSTLIDRAAPGSPIGAPAGFNWTPPARILSSSTRINFEIVPKYTAVQSLSSDLHTAQDAGKSLLHLELRGSNPPLLSETVNLLAKGLEELASQLQRRKYQELEQMYREQYKIAGEVLRKAENALTGHQIATAGTIQGASPILTGNVAAIGDAGVTAAFQQQVQLEMIRQDRIALEKAIAAGKNGTFNIEALSMVPSVRASPSMMKLMEDLVAKESGLRHLSSGKYTAEAEPIQRQRQELENLQKTVVPAAAGQLLAELRTQEAILSPKVNAAFAGMKRIPSLALTSARLERERTNAEITHTAIRAQHEAVRLALLSSTPNVRLLDAAQPPTKASVNLAPTLLLVSLIGSIGLGVFGAVLTDKKDNKVRFPEQVVNSMRLPILAALPHVGYPRMKSGLKQSNEIIEALRALRVRLIHSQGVDGPLMLTVSSPAAGEGKSFVTVNLALSFAHAGYRTLLFDGDLRRGVQHKTLEVHGAPGVTDILAGASTLEDAVQETTYKDLYLLASGTRTQRAPELLQSRAMRELLARCRERFDVVIVDSPPLAAGVDPLVLATLTSNMLLVIRSDETDLPMAMAKLEVAQTLPVRTIGAVLNCVRAQSAFRYYAYDLSGYVEDESSGERRDSFDKVLSGRSSE